MPNATVPAAAGGITSRRAALAAIAGAGAALSMARADAATPVSTSNIADLAARYATAHHRFREAIKAFNIAEIRLVRPPAPEALFRQPGDLSLFSAGGFHPGGRWWYGDDGVIESLSRDQCLCGAAAARRDEIIEAHDSWRAARRTAEDGCGLAEAEAKVAAADDALDAALLPIVRLQSTDPAALKLKLQVFADIQERSDLLDNAIEAAIENGPWGDALALSIARDLCSFVRMSA